jgi:cell shape-determining protein MreD
LIFLQVFLLNNIRIGELGITPYFYILFLLLLPFEVPGWLLLIFGFVTGISIDIFSDTAGLHSGACVFIAFVRPYVLRLISIREGYSPETSPGIYHYGIPWFMKYATILVALHHFIFFLIMYFSFESFFKAFPLYIFSVIFTLILIIISQFLIFKK